MIIWSDKNEIFGKASCADISIKLNTLGAPFFTILWLQYGEVQSKVEGCANSVEEAIAMAEALVKIREKNPK